MKFTAPILLIIILSLIPGQKTKPEPAQLVLKNGNIYTLNERQPRAEAVAVRYGKIVYVGPTADVKKFEGKGTRAIDLKGKTVLPGLSDAHYHLAGVGQREMALNLEGTTSLEDFLAKVKVRVDQAKSGEWVTGRGWIETYWKPPVFPTRQDIDRISPNNPVYLVRADGHGGVANSAALQLAEITKETASPFGGEIMKDKTTGEPNGMLLDRAQGLVNKLIPPPTAADQEQALIIGAKRSVDLGWTQIQNAGGSWNEVDLHKKLYGEHKINLLVYQAIRGLGDEPQTWV